MVYVLLQVLVQVQQQYDVFFRYAGTWIWGVNMNVKGAYVCSSVCGCMYVGVCMSVYWCGIITLTHQYG
ncbi:hypothetical protein EON63_14575 [archaeon]|nr:MAG: hypothetical protein EON63_14575 [archaeon]